MYSSYWRSVPLQVMVGTLRAVVAMCSLTASELSLISGPMMPTQPSSARSCQAPTTSNSSPRCSPSTSLTISRTGRSRMPAAVASSNASRTASRNVCLTSSIGKSRQIPTLTDGPAGRSALMSRVLTMSLLGAMWRGGAHRAGAPSPGRYCRCGPFEREADRGANTRDEVDLLALGDGERAERGEDFFERDFEFLAGQVRAETTMDTAPESHVAGVVAVDVGGHRVIEDAVVSVGRTQQQHHEL